jgi:hypothetical protein
MRCPCCGAGLPSNISSKVMGEVGGRQTSAKKKRSSRLNGRKGGRPKGGKKQCIALR